MGLYFLLIKLFEFVRKYLDTPNSFLFPIAKGNLFLVYKNHLLEKETYFYYIYRHNDKIQ